MGLQSVDTARPSRTLIGAFAFLLATSLSRLVCAEDVTVPPSLQAALLAKVAGYDRNLPRRAGDQVLTLIVTRKDGDSERVAGQLEEGLRALSTIAGIPSKVERLAFVSAGELAMTCRRRRASIVYVTPSFRDDARAIATALRGTDVLTVGAVPSYVTDGTVLSFDLESGHPKILVHVGRAGEQNVSFDPNLFRVAKVVDR